MSEATKTSSTSGTSSNARQQTGADVVAAASDVTDQISGQVSGLSQQVQQQVNTQVASQKDKLVDTLETVSLLLHQAGEHANLQDKAMLSQYVDQAAQKVTTWTDSLRDQDATQLLAETKNLASRQPLLFMGGALALGFAGARFFRTSAQQPETSTRPSSSTSSNPAADDLALNSGAQYDSMGATDLTGSSFGVLPETDMPYESDLTSGTTGYLADIEGSFVDPEGTLSDPLAGTDDFTRTGRS